MPSKLLPISKEEQECAAKLTTKRRWIYNFSRGCLREVISNMTGAHPLEIPLKADPGKPPTLSAGWGYISLSHCSDALLIGWSKEKIGVDIERRDRKFQAHKLSKRFFKQSENHEIEDLTASQAKEEVLKRWVVKEAAIKWQNGKISNDLSQWILDKKSSFAYHKKLGYQVKVYQQSYNQWTYAIALDRDSKIPKPIICSN